MIHIWHEDSENSAITQFWKFLKDNKVSNIFEESDIQGFGGNDKVVNALKNADINEHDTYYVFIDYVRDNRKALRYYMEARDFIIREKYCNVHLIKLLSFEYLMLGFQQFELWTEPVRENKLYTSCKSVRKELIRVVESNNLSWINNDIIVGYISEVKGLNIGDKDFKEQLLYISLENIVTVLLSQMTNGGTAQFGISKTNFGVCWRCNCCCKYDDSIGGDKCRIYSLKKTDDTKARDLWNLTDAHRYIKGYL